jgi:hypothetical protein
MTEENKETMYSYMGRPRAFKTVEELQTLIDEYFAWAVKWKKPLTIERLASFLDVDRKTINNYSRDSDFFPTIKKAVEFILASKVERLNEGDKVVGVIFDLKNNHDFSDKVHHINENFEGGRLTSEDEQIMREALETKK